MQQKQVSFTQLMTYVQCPQHYLFKYVLGIKRQPRKAFKRGFAFHETLQYHFDEKKKDGKGISLPEAKEFFIASFINALEDYKQELAEARPFLTREYLSKEKSAAVAEMADSGIKGLEVYFRHVNPYIKPDLVEEPFEFVIGKALPGRRGVNPHTNRAETAANRREAHRSISVGVKVIGRIDLTDTKGVIHELKTSRAAPSKQDIRSDAQLAVYQMGYEAITGKAPAGISKDYIVLSKRNPRAVRFRVVRPFINRRVVAGNILAIIEAIQNNVFYCLHPAESWICSKEWCSYYKMHQELKRVGFEAFMEKYRRR